MKLPRGGAEGSRCTGPASDAAREPYGSFERTLLQLIDNIFLSHVHLWFVAGRELLPGTSVELVTVVN